MPDLSISIVSHRQAILVHELLNDLQQHCRGQDLEVLLTLNLPEELPFDPTNFSFPLRVLRNFGPKGFGANHNAAFTQSDCRYFCILNPDIRLNSNPFPQLLAHLATYGEGLIAPMVHNSAGGLEDSARYFPRIGEIINKILGKQSAIFPIDSTSAVSYPDWVAGMFMLLPSKIFRQIGGFDERYFLYYEDVDLCARLTLANYKIIYCSKVSVVHCAQRSSHKSLRFMRMHLTSMLKFFSSSHYRRLQKRVAK